MAECADENEEHTLRIEAAEVIKEVAYAVTFVDISKVLPSSESLVFLNLCTKENETFCVELSVKGFRVVGRKFDMVDGSCELARYHETIYSLLDDVSPGYRNSFSEILAQKLQQLQHSEEHESMDTK